MFLKRIQPSMNVLTAMTAGILAYGGWRLIHARMEHQYAIKATQQEVLCVVTMTFSGLVCPQFQTSP